MKIAILLISILLSPSLFAKEKRLIVTTTPNAAALLKELLGDSVEIEALVKSYQDPHYLEAKPSYTWKLAKADLLVSIGLGLEDAWLNLVIEGARRPEFRKGGASHWVLGDWVEPIEKLSNETKLSRKEGDLHAEGNPHFLLGPSYTRKLSQKLAEKLSQWMPEKKEDIFSRAKKFQEELQNFLDSQRQKNYTKKLVSYHKTFNYFLKDFSIELIGYLEPKPGIPPTASHVLSLIQGMQKQKVTKIFIESYFDTSIAKRIKKDHPEVDIHQVPVAVDEKNGSASLLQLYQKIFKDLEG